MRKLIYFQLCLILLLLVIPGCSIYMSVYTDYDHSKDFSKYKTFAWLPDRDTSTSEINNQIIRNNTRNYFTFEFARRAYQIDVDSPDVFLDLVIKTNKQESTYYSRTYTSYPGWYICNPYFQICPPNYYYIFPYDYNYSVYYREEKIEYWECSITLNVIDRRENKLVWTGTAKGDLYDPEHMKENIHPAVYRILRRYPVKPIRSKISS